jgi:hypothetical protein
VKTNQETIPGFAIVDTPNKSVRANYAFCERGSTCSKKKAEDTTVSPIYAVWEKSGTSDQLRFFGFSPKVNADAPRLLCFLGRGLVPIRTESSRLGVALQTQTIATG